MRTSTRNLLLLAAAPLVVLAGPASVLGRQTHLVNRYACDARPCAYDLTGDGVADPILGAGGMANGYVRVRVGRAEYPVAPNNWVDATWKTHVAVVPRTSGRPHLVVWDGTDERGFHPVNAAWEWRGAGFERVPQSRLDAAVARAMASYDDTGTFWRRLLVMVVMIYVLPVWWLFLLAARFGLWWHEANELAFGARMRGLRQAGRGAMERAS